MKTRITLTALGLFFAVGLVAGILFPQSSTSSVDASAPATQESVKSEANLARGSADLIADPDGPVVGFVTVMVFTGLGIGAGILLGLHLRVEDRPMPRRRPIQRMH